MPPLAILLNLGAETLLNVTIIRHIRKDGDVNSQPRTCAQYASGDAHFPPAIIGWRVIVSDEGRLWASRAEPFTAGQVAAGAFRTVDADDADALRVAVAEQERLAEEAR